MSQSINDGLHQHHADASNAPSLEDHPEVDAGQDEDGSDDEESFDHGQDDAAKISKLNQANKAKFEKWLVDYPNFHVYQFVEGSRLGLLWPEIVGWLQCNQ